MDGAGKSTQARLLETEFTRLGYTCLTVREPGGTAIGDRVREILLDRKLSEMSVLTELFLYMASRSQLVHQIIAPALDEGKMVICDRFLISSLVYQGMVGQLGEETVKSLGELATGGAMPDRLIILDVPPQMGLGRITQTRDRMESKGEEFHTRVREAYLKIPQFYPEARIIDGTQPVEEVQKKVWEHVKDVIPTNSRP